MTSDTSGRAEGLIEEGKRHLEAGEREQAERCFRAAAKLHALPQAVNNWALCRFLARDYDAAYQILSPLLAQGSPAPYSHALASLCLSAKGDELNARIQLRAAIRDFEAGFGLSLTVGSAPDGWLEYADIITQAAGALRDHKLVLELYRRWAIPNQPDLTFAAGVAAFNLRRFKQAARYWAQVNDQRWQPWATLSAQVAELCEAGLVSPFELGYQDDIAEWRRVAKEEGAAKLANSTYARVFMIAQMFSPDAKDPSLSAEALVAAGGEWGVEFGRRLIKASRVPLPIKMGAAAGLASIGAVDPDEPIEIIHEGRTVYFRIESKELVEFDEKLGRELAEAKRLRDAGQIDAALSMLESLRERDNTIYLPAWITTANILRDRGQLAEAEKMLSEANALSPGHPVVLFNLAGLYCQLHDFKRARTCVEEIDPTGTTEEFHRRLAELKSHIEREIIFNALGGQTSGEFWRRDQEEKPITVNLHLRTALRRIPVQWLNAAAAIYNAPVAKHRKDRERELAALLLVPRRVKAALEQEAAPVREAIRLVISRGGWCKLQLLTRRYGEQTGDGFWWDEEPPKSVIGRLQLLGLVYVGRANIDGKRDKVAVVPLELRQVLLEALPVKSVSKPLSE